MKGLVFGNGFLGNRIADYFKFDLIANKLTSEDVIKDILDAYKPDIIVNCIGKTGRPNIDWCETHKYETFNSNVLVPLHLAEEAKRRNVYMVHVGSGCVYFGDNQGKGYDEEDKPNEFSYYTRTKIMSENALKEFDNVLQVRVRLLLDNKSHPRNLIDKLLKYDKLVDTQESMTYIPDFLKALQALIAKEKTGIYNVVNSGTISPHDLMVAYFNIVDATHQFKKITFTELENIVLAKRSSGKLSTDKLTRDTGLVMPDINVSIVEALKVYGK